MSCALSIYTSVARRVAARRFSLSRQRWYQTGYGAADTIYALSTHPGKSAIAVVRISGPQTGRALQLLVAPTKKAESAAGRQLRARRAVLARIVDPSDSSSTLDTGVCMWFPGPRSYTGEDMAELQVHGGTAVVSSVLQALGRIQGLRLAEAGEFTRRALYNDKMDLTAVEGVADLINAETEAQRRLAVRQAQGELGQMYERWRGAIVGLMAGMEASIDFGEEENIEDGVVADVVAAGHELVQEMRAHLDDARRGEIMRSGVSVAIVGPPNSGKSTLLNLLAQRQVAIVSAVAGTTRDIVEATLDVGGFPVVVRDTAGLRPTGDAVEAEGVRRALAAAQSADLRICVVDASRLAAGDTAGDVFGGAWRALLRQPHTLVVANKADLLADVDDADAWARAHGVAGAALLSCATRRGWDALLRRMAAHIRHAWGTADADARCRLPLTRARHRQHMQRCVDHMTRFLATRDVVLAAEELRAAAAALGRITGRTGTEDVLDALFSQFCIGK